jgi:thiol-disulfide isomerase/thioredoxin
MKKIIYSFCFIFFAAAFNAGAQEIPKWKLADLQSAIKNADQPTVFNFWATFCKPCLEEIPYFQQLVKKYDAAGVKLVLVSLDMSGMYPKKIKDFAVKRGLTAPIKFLDETNADLFCPAVDESWSGAIPASLFVNNKTGYRKFFEEQLKKDAFEKELKKMIGK